MRTRWPLVALLSALLTSAACAGSWLLFALEAWGARGEPKSALFQAWAFASWCGLPLLALGFTVAAIVGLIRSRAREGGSAAEPAWPERGGSAPPPRREGRE
ncbi:MAG: hypothetical protein R3B99_30745 [Polyangiales bacterium]|nr:hypothetical protein [Sandaracinus sp.]